MPRFENFVEGISVVGDVVGHRIYEGWFDFAESMVLCPVILKDFGEFKQARKWGAQEERRRFVKFYLLVEGE